MLLRFLSFSDSDSGFSFRVEHKDRGLVLGPGLLQSFTVGPGPGLLQSFTVSLTSYTRCNVTHKVVYRFEIFEM